jgi:type IV pilus assembly protein PilX
MKTKVRVQRIPAQESGSTRARQRGAALAIGLILLLVLTILAITGMSTATLELRMAGNKQYQERAFEAAEVGIERAMNSGLYNTGVPTLCPGPGCPQGNTVPNTAVDAADRDSFEFEMNFDTNTGATAVPGGGYSLGTGLQAYHFVIESTGESARGAESQNVQSFYIVGPGG